MEILDKTEDANYKSIGDAYAEQSIFVTGATGFLGKVFVEKVLYSCPKISKIYILIREKKNMSIQERITKMFEMPVFNRLREERPQDLKKIVPINGDITIPNLGIKQADEELLLKTVSMVFHIAATVKFTETFEKILEINVKGTKHMLEFCQKLNNIKAFVYISTAFTNSNIDVVEECVYPLPSPLHEAEKIADETFFSKEDTIKLLGGSINAYTLSKELAENLVAKYQSIIPSVIVRPSIVVSSKAEPIVGWIDTWHGAAGITLPVAQGLNRTILSNSRYIMDFIPVDYVANTIIVAATKCSRSNGVAVYNCTTSCENPISIRKYFSLCTQSCARHKFNIMPFPKPLITSSKWLYNFILYVQRVPPKLLDLFLYVAGEQPRYAKYQKIALKAQEASENIIKRTWKVCAKQTCALSASLSENDRKHFGCDPRHIVWEEFIPTFMEGMKTFLLKQ